MTAMSDDATKFKLNVRSSYFLNFRNIMAQHRLEILGFMRSLELIDELPAPRFSL